MSDHHDTNSNEPFNQEKYTAYYNEQVKAHPYLATPAKEAKALSDEQAAHRHQFHKTLASMAPHMKSQLRSDGWQARDHRTRESDYNSGSGTTGSIAIQAKY